MDKLIDYTKYTVALAVGLLLYLPANFIPAGSFPEFCVLLMLLCLLALSSLAGIMLYTRATTILVTGTVAGSDRYISLWGWIHLITLLVCFAGSTYFFVRYKVFEPKQPIECTASFSGSAGSPVTLKFPCSS